MTEQVVTAKAFVTLAINVKGQWDESQTAAEIKTQAVQKTIERLKGIFDEEENVQVHEIRVSAIMGDIS